MAGYDALLWTFEPSTRAACSYVWTRMMVARRVNEREALLSETVETQRTGQGDAQNLGRARQIRGARGSFRRRCRGFFLLGQAAERAGGTAMM